LTGLLDEAEFAAARAKFEDDKHRAKIRLMQIEAQIAKYDTDKAKESDCLTNFRNYKGVEKLDKTIIGALT
jgi:hypothetical protein